MNRFIGHMRLDARPCGWIHEFPEYLARAQGTWSSLETKTPPPGLPVAGVKFSRR